MLDILFKPFGYHAPKNFKIICLSTLRVPDEGYYKDGSCALNVLLLPLLCHSIRDMYIVILYHESSAWINLRENRWGNQEWTIQRHWHNWVYQTQNEDKQNKNTTQKTRKMSTTDHTKLRCEPRYQRMVSSSRFL